MFSKPLRGVRIAVLAVDGFEQMELTSPRKHLLSAGADVEVVSLRPGSIRGMNLIYPGKKVSVDRMLLTADPREYDGLLIPGGFVNPDFLRQSETALDFVRAFDAAGKPIATICHAPWVLVSAGLVRGRRLTSWPGIKDDVRNAGGLWEDKAVVVDGNWLSSRGPQDLLRFNPALVEHFGPDTVASEREHMLPAPSLGTLVAGGLALAALGYASRRFGSASHSAAAFRPTGAVARDEPRTRVASEQPG